MSARPAQALAACVAVCCMESGASESVEDAVRRCAQHSEPAERLGCFDELAKALPQVKADRFGLTADIKQKRDPGAMQAAKDESLDARIASLRRAAGGEWIFTLDNQQVWAETEVRSNIDFAVGDAVRIEHGALSSLWLVADRHRKVRVKRLR